MKYSAAVLTFALLAPLAALSAQEKGKAKGAEKKAMKMDRAAHVVAPDQITWGPAPASLPAGAKAVVLDGDPKKGGMFTMRLWLPDGYQVAPHFHPAAEHVTVLQGTFMVGMGDKFDESQMKELAVGTFAMVPRGMRHYAKAGGETIIQVHAMGPWRLNYVNKADDPSKSMTK